MMCKCGNSLKVWQSITDVELMSKFDGKNIVIPDDVLTAIIYNVGLNERIQIVCTYKHDITKKLLLYYCDRENLFYCFSNDYIMFSYEWSKKQ